MSVYHPADALQQSITWEQYYELLTQSENGLKLLDLADDLLRKVNIESKLYNLMNTLDRDLIWVITTKIENEHQVATVAIMQAIASCSEKVTLKIALSDKNGLKEEMACWEADTKRQMESWVSGNEFYNLSLPDKISMIQEEFILLVRKWNEGA